jgi:dihydropteroate synthase
MTNDSSFIIHHSTLTRRHYTIPLPQKSPLQLGARTLIMGVLNVTPDSFADGGLYLDPERAVEAGLRMVDEGADVIDIGGESTRPGAEPVPADEELHRVLPVIERLAPKTSVPLSIDTYKAIVAREAIARGAVIVNDVSGLQYDSDLGTVVAETGAALVLMHTRGRSGDMYGRAVYTDGPREVLRELSEAIARAERCGVAREAIIVDPGLGFAKRAEHSFDVLAHLGTIAAIDRPILCGPSRKSFLKAAVGDRPPEQRAWATAAAVTASILLGAHIIRVHDVAAMVDVARVADRIREHL